MTLADQFGRRLSVQRRRLGVSQETLVRFAGLHRATVYLLENGRRDPRLETIVALANAPGIDPAELVKGFRP